MTVCKVPADRFAKLVDPPLYEINRLAREGKTVANVDLGEYGVLNSYGTLDHVRIPEPMMENLGVGGASKTTAAEGFEAGRESIASVQVDGEPAEVEVERENPDDEENGHLLPAKRPQKSTLMHQFGAFALYAGAAVGVGLALNALLGSGNRPVR